MDYMHNQLEDTKISTNCYIKFDVFINENSPFYVSEGDS